MQKTHFHDFNLTRRQFVRLLSLIGAGYLAGCAANPHYQRYIEVVNEGKQAEYAYRRLVEWGYVK